MIGGFFDLIDQYFDHVWEFYLIFCNKKEVLGNLSFLVFSQVVEIFSSHKILQVFPTKAMPTLTSRFASFSAP